MSYTPSLDDTQPRLPVQIPDQPEQYDEDIEPDSSGPGCLVWGLVGIIGSGFAVVIVFLAGVAGWTSGQRTAHANATATRSAEINDQLNRIPGDIASGNLEMLNIRIRYLAAATPGIQGVAEYAVTATALYLTNQPTITPTPPAAAPTSQASPAATTEAPIVAPTSPNGGYDLVALLEEARADVTQGQWNDAAELLEVIMALDSTYETAEVRGLMLQALTSYARALYQNDRLAEAIIITDRAEAFGDIGDLNYERYLAALYLDAQNTIGTNFPAAINALQQIYNAGPSRYQQQAGQLLVDQYLAYADAYVAGGEYCPAVIQYQNALNLQNRPDIDAKFQNAQLICQQGTPVPGVAGTPGTPPGIAPVGVPITPTPAS